MISHCSHSTGGWQGVVAAFATIAVAVAILVAIKIVVDMTWGD